ncbi:hypothetical protein BH10BDE1_BH10BDE1_16380 [soil metagenome]
MTSASVEKNTGRGWDEWIVLLDKAGARSMSHGEIAKLLKTKFKQPPWWQLNVALGFQYHTGQKMIGVNTKGQYTVAIGRTLPLSQKTLWKWITSEEGQAIWLKPLSTVMFSKGVEFEVEGGVFCQVRTLKAPQRIRFSWHDTDWEKPTFVQVAFHPRPGDKCGFGVSHDGIKDARTKERLKEMWRAQLDEVAAHLREE